MKALLIDDEADCLEMLAILIKRYCPTLQIMAQINDPSVAVQIIHDIKPDVVFLDVEMPELSGFGVLERCRDLNFHVIFTTAFNKYALKAIKYSALDYLLKPIDVEELVSAVNKIKNSNQSPQKEVLINYTKSVREKIVLANSEGVEVITIADIVLCEADGNYTKIYTLQGKPTLFTKSLKDIEEMLQESGFFRIFQSYLINLKHVVRYIKTEGGEVEMTNGKKLPISRHNKQSFLELLSKM